MVNSILDCTVLNNQVNMPWLGFGLFLMEPGAETVNAVRAALQAGYRSIDTAMIYENESDAGKAIQSSGIPREELFITTKLWNSDQGYESTLKAFEVSRKMLGLEYIDLYLIHWPVRGRYVDTWRALEKLYRDGVTRAIGLSNFLVHHIQDILATCTIPPALDQVELHPELSQPELQGFCRENHIQLEAWAPLGQGQSLKDPTIGEIARKHGKTPAQVLIRWDLQKGIVSIPKSNKPSRIAENAKVFDFELDAGDTQRIDGLDENRRFGADPDNFDF